MTLRRASLLFLAFAVVAVVVLVSLGWFGLAVERRLASERASLRGLDAQADMISARADELVLLSPSEADTDAFAADVRSLQDALAAWLETSPDVATGIAALDSILAILRNPVEPTDPRAPTNEGHTHVGPLAIPVSSLARINEVAQLGVQLDASIAALQTVHGASAFALQRRVHVSLRVLELFLGLLVIGSFLFVRRGLVRPLADIATSADATQHAAHRVKSPPTRWAEFTMLVRSLNAMLERREQAAQELRDAADLLETKTKQLSEAQRIGRIGSWVWDVERDTHEWTDEIYHILGLEPQSQAASMDLFARFVPPEEQERFDHTLARVTSGEQIDAFTLRLLIDGQMRTVQLRARLTLDEDGNPAKLEGTTQDITDFASLRNELEDQQRLHDTVARLGKVGGWRVNRRSGELIWSEATRSIHEAPEDFVPVVDTGIDFYVPEHRPVIRTAFERLLDAGVPYDLELRIVTMTGREVWVRTIGEALYDDKGEIVAVEGAFQDIDQQKRAETRASLIERRLTSVLEASSDGFLLTDATGVPTYTNRAAASLLGLDDVGVDLPLWEALPPAVAREIGPHLTWCIKNRSASSISVFDEPNGRGLEFRVEPLVDEVAVVVRDVTDEARAMAQLREREALLIEARDSLSEAVDQQRRLIDALPAKVALVDRDGIIRDVNEGWRTFHREIGLADGVDGLGATYLSTALFRTKDGTDHAAAVANGLSGVLAGDRTSFVHRIPFPMHEERRWFDIQLHAMGHDPQQGGIDALVLHLDVTDEELAREHRG